MTERPEALFKTARRRFHAVLQERVLRLDKGVLSNADKGNKASKAIALGIARRIGLNTPGVKLKGQTAGNEFEIATALFVRETFLKLNHLRPGDWMVQKIGEKPTEEDKPVKRKEVVKDFKRLIKIAQFEQYRHLIAIAKAASENSELAASLGSDYIIKPDVVIFRQLVSDDEINCDVPLVDNSVALMSSLRKSNGGSPLLHASVSCKLTIRSDRSQNSRSEALNLIRNRRGKLPHVVVVTGEPLPSRLASIALGGGDIDCVYHFALPELRETVKELGLSDSEEALNIMINGKRLKDISDLPLDLAV
ncbi:MAG TPA: NgoMIV family type II restriction endonuclease [Bryobacteraceae bacterium]|nr:NgoMIV family type II restriction endonuclease [Bryobacteraceae bacterium]